MDIFSTLANICTILTFIASIIFFIYTFCKILVNYLAKASLKKNFGSDLFDLDTIKKSIHYYVPTDCTSIDPANQPEMKQTIAVRNNIFKEVSEHLLSKEAPHRHLLLLADSGMGKTSFVLNYYVYNQKQFKHKRHKIFLIPLGIPNVIEKIKAISDKSHTVIFLDAFDEDKEAIKDHKKRLEDLMNACYEFKRVLITCRTQFFAKEEDIPNTTNIIRFGPRALNQKGEYEFWKLYIAPLTDEQIQKYLYKRYYFWQFSQRKKAKEIINQIPLLSVRPMLLTYVPFFVEDGTAIKNSYQLYNKIVEGWLKREADWIEDSKKILNFSKKLAFDIYNKSLDRKEERMPPDELKIMAENSDIPVNQKMFIPGRSLLNRDANGNCKFAHRSIMEFLFVEYFLELTDIDRPQIEWTDLMTKFLLEKIQVYQQEGKEFTFSLYNVDFKSRDMAFIPKGCFLYGKSDKNINYNYFIDVFPVTNQQYKEFIDNTKYPVPYRDGKWAEPYSWNKDKKTFPEGMGNHPVVIVSYVDAIEYCKWRSSIKKLQGDKTFRLPKEEEWEKAARGTDGREYPWGDEFDKEKCNTNESGIGKTSEVNRYPLGISPYGCYDMAGNVWEWTDSWYDKGNTMKVLRGGSWNDNQDSARCANRIRLDPEYRTINIGFRCARTL